MAAPIYRPYSREEIAAAARSVGLDPAFLEALYSIESSNGTNPKAMGVQTVKRKRDTTMVRGPFQLEDGTVDDYKRKNKLANLDISDPDQYLRAAAWIARDKYDQAGGDYAGAFKRYLGTGQDQFGTTTEAYRDRGMREMARIKGSDDTSSNLELGSSSPSPVESPFMHGANAGGGDDLFGMPSNMGLSRPSSPTGTMSWKDFLADARGPDLAQSYVRGGALVPSSSMGDFPDMGPIGFGIPEEQGGDLSASLEPATDVDIDAYLSSLVNDQMKDRDFLNALA